MLSCYLPYNDVILWLRVNTFSILPVTIGQIGMHLAPHIPKAPKFLRNPY
jgi:hypothetical protein